MRPITRAGLVLSLAAGTVALGPVGSVPAHAVTPATLGSTARPGAVARPRAGDKAPRFTLKAVDSGETRSLERLLEDGSPRGVAVVFLSCKCPYAAQARQPLGELFKTYGGKVTFVGVNANQNETLDDIKADAALSFPFPMLRDDGSKVADLYGAERTPEAFLIDAKGVIRYHGGVAELGAALGELTEGRAIAKAEAKAFGCTIKRKP
jgi:peroxiredoxin